MLINRLRSLVEAIPVSVTLSKLWTLLGKAEEKIVGHLLITHRKMVADSANKIAGSLSIKDLTPFLLLLSKRTKSSSIQQTCHE